jgi:hypothetical protein
MYNDFIQELLHQGITHREIELLSHNNIINKNRLMDSNFEQQPTTTKTSSDFDNQFQDKRVIVCISYTLSHNTEENSINEVPIVVDQIQHYINEENNLSSLIINH